MMLLDVLFTLFLTHVGHIANVRKQPASLRSDPGPHHRNQRPTSPEYALEKKAVEQGDIKFFELGALSVGSKLKKQEVTIELTDFVIPIDDVPEDARKSIKHWSQMIDYWAVDWDFKDDTFHNQWQSYRTRQDPKLELKANYDYSEPGEYKVMVKVIDILGNDTTKTLDIKVK